MWSTVLHATLQTVREAEMTDSTSEAITDVLQSATDVPMLGVLGDEDWTPENQPPC